MPLILHILGYVFLAITAAGVTYALAAAWLVRRFLARTIPEATQRPPVTLLKPLHGAESGLEQALASFAALDYPAPVQMLFGVHAADDPAADAVRALQAARPDLDIQLIADPRLAGQNRKISNVINLMPQARHDVLVLSDSDIGVSPDYLIRITDALAQPKAGVVTCLYTGVGAAGFWSELSAMAVSYQFLPNAVLGVSLGLAQPCFGSTIALTRQTLAAMGGFEAFADLLADDFEIGRAARNLGLTIAIPPLAVSHACAESSAKELFDHEIRWGRTIRLIEGAGYAGSAVTYAIPMSLIALVLLGPGFAGLGGVAAALFARLVLKLQVDAVTDTRAGKLWLIPLRDVLSFAVFLASFASNQVRWRGRRFRVQPDGVLTHH
jgi:ceramide glucosyltransferase